ncbi:MAG: PKD domain-containing protein, partial [Sphingobacteriales bacterium]
MRFKFGELDIKYFWAAFFCLLLPWNTFAVTADFSVSSTSGCAPLIVSFTNKSSGGSTYFWRLGNGNTSTLTSPGAIYSNPGTYTVTLIAKDASGNIDSIVKKDLLTVYASPVGDFKVDVKKGCAPLSVSFTDLSKKGSADIVSYLWDFGDGNTSTLQNPKNTYTLTGNFNVTLIVKDKNGCSHTITRSKYIIVPKKPTVTFTAIDSTACDTPFTVTFNPTAASGIGGSLTYSWEFGDGTTSSAKNPKHKYTKLGNYDITLTVTDTANCSSTIKKTAFIIIGKSKANFSLKPTVACPPARVSFSNLSSPDITGTKY